jgi:hypothetical protein
MEIFIITFLWNEEDLKSIFIKKHTQTRSLFCAEFLHSVVIGLFKDFWNNTRLFKLNKIEGAEFYG